MAAGAFIRQPCDLIGRDVKEVTRRFKHAAEGLEVVLSNINLCLVNSAIRIIEVCHGNPRFTELPFR